MWLPEVGLYHYKNRTYSPGLGRFLQADPIGYLGGMNLYAYVGNDPVNNRDPWGLEDCKPEDAECNKIIVTGTKPPWPAWLVDFFIDLLTNDNGFASIPVRPITLASMQVAVGEPAKEESEEEKSGELPKSKKECKQAEDDVYWAKVGLGIAYGGATLYVGAIIGSGGTLGVTALVGGGVITGAALQHAHTSYDRAIAARNEACGA